ADAVTVVAGLFRGARRHITWHQVAERRVPALEVVIALVFGDVAGMTGVALLLRHPHAPVIAQRLAHQGEFGLVLAGHRNTRGVNLRIARITEIGPAPVGTPRRRGVAAHR